MPRQPDGTYRYPDGTPGNTGQTIFSARYNTFLDDLALAMNTPLPVNMGGTGSSTLGGALTSLNAEIAAPAQTVVNYDSHIFKNGGFASAPATAGAPNATDWFYGTAIASADNNNNVIVVYSLATGAAFIRRKVNGTWNAWLNDSGSDKLPLAGGTLTGGLSATAFTLAGAAGAQADFYASSSGVTHWLIRLTDNFELHRFDNVGGYLGSPMQVNRLTGAATLAQTLSVGGQMSSGSVWSPTGYLGSFTSDNATITNCSSGGTFNLTAVGCNTFTANAITDNGGLTVQGTASLNGSATAPVFTASAEFQSTHTDGILVLRVAGAGHDPVVIDSRGQLNAYWGYMVKPGVFALGRGHAFNIDYNTDGSSSLWIDASYMGNFAFTSDYRIKKDVTPLVSMWDRVKALNPISYTHTDYTPPPTAGQDPPLQLIVADDIERWGFIAHELQETLIPTAATGVKDDPVVIQSPNPWTVVASLTKALQEAMVRIEALETRGA